MPRATHEAAQQTRRDVMHAAVRTFARQGYAGTRLRDVAEALGVSRGAIYGHFTSKKRLFLEVIKVSQDPVYALLDDMAAAAASGSPRAALRQMMLGWHDLLLHNARHRAAFELVLSKTTFVHDLPELYEREKRLTRAVIAAVTAVVEDGQARGEFPGGLDPGEASLTLYLHLMGVTQSWLFNPALFSLTDRAEPLTDTALAALDAQPACR